PVVDVAGHVVTAERAGAVGVQADDAGPADVHVEVGQARAGPVGAPGGAAAVGASGGLLPLGVGGEGAAGPAGVGVGLVPGDAGDGLLRAVPAGLGPVGGGADAGAAAPLPAGGLPPVRGVVAAGLDEAGEAGVGDGVDVDPEGG